MTTEIERQNLAIAHTFVTQFLGQGDMSVAEQVLDENVQAITGLKPDGPINGREEYKQKKASNYENWRHWLWWNWGHGGNALGKSRT
jgi:hypothetical protein